MVTHWAVTAVSTHSRLKAAGHKMIFRTTCHFKVSTHSRLKAAGRWQSQYLQQRHRFNTQPPEGGWGLAHLSHSTIRRFNTQPPEGGWTPTCSGCLFYFVSTHSRLKAAGNLATRQPQHLPVSTHSRLKAAGCVSSGTTLRPSVSTHSRLKAAGSKL